MKDSRYTFILTVFFFSGVTGLIYEIVWTRMLTLIFGHTVYAVSTVLTAFMAGLAIGSYVFGRIADKTEQPLILYAILEVFIGITAFFTPFIFENIDVLFRPIYQSFASSFYIFSLIRFTICFSILIVPTILMGATLPVLSKAVSFRMDNLGSRVGFLYTANTIGAVLGCFLTGFLFILLFGSQNSIFFAASINVLIAFCVWIFSRRPLLQETKNRKAEKVKSGDVFQISSPKLKLFLVLFGLSGFAALALEVLWTRALVFTFFQGSSTYAFTSMLTVFLLGIGVGSWIFSTFVDEIKNNLRVFAWLEILIGILSIISLPILLYFSQIQFSWSSSITWINTVTYDFLKALAVMIPATLLFGATFPVVVSICIDKLENVGKGVGNIYFFNTVGSILGSFIAGFIIIPLIGMTKSFLVLGALCIVIGLTAISMDKELKARSKAAYFVVAFLVISCAWIMLPLNTKFQDVENNEKLLFYEEGPSATVSVVEEPSEQRRLLMDNVFVAGTNRIMMTDQKSLAHIPCLIHPNPKKVLTVGFGSGGASWSFTTHPYLEDIDCVEIAPTVLKASKYFKNCNFDLFEDDRYEVILEDAKSYLLLSEEKYDIISTDCTDLSYKSNSNLYTLDYFKTCKNSLREDGILVVWMPLDGLTKKYFKVALNTFTEVYPKGSIWYMNNYPTHYILLVGTQKELSIDWSKFKQRMEIDSVEKDLEMIDLSNPYKLLSCYLMGSQDFREFAGNVPLNTEDKPILEFQVPKLKGSANENLSLLFEATESTMPPVTGVPAEDKDKFRKKMLKYLTARNHSLKGHIMYRLENKKGALYEYQRALSDTPNDESLKKLVGISDKDITKLKKDIEKNPEDYKARFDLAYILSKKGEYETAIKHLRKILKDKPDSFPAFFGLADIFVKMEKFGKARKIYQKLKNKNLGYEMAEKLANQRKILKLKQSLAEDPDNLENLMKLKKLYLRKNNIYKAIELLESRDNLKGNKKYLMEKADLYKKAHMFKKARRTYHNILKENSDYAQALYYLMEINFRDNRLNAAEKQFKSVLKQDPQNPSIWFNGARIKSRQGQKKKALERLRKSIEYGGTRFMKIARNDPSFSEKMLETVKNEL